MAQSETKRMGWLELDAMLQEPRNFQAPCRATSVANGGGGTRSAGHAECFLR